MKNAEEHALQRDRMRFIKNSLCSNLAILGILFNVFYFVSIYKSDVETFYYNITIGASIVYNLVFMLAVFLSSEGVKNYKKGYSYLLAAIGALQVVRIFYLPMKAHASTITVSGESIVVMPDGQFTWVVICLAASAVCLIASAVVNFIRCNELESHLKSLEIQGA